MRAALLGLLLAFVVVGGAAGGDAATPSAIGPACASPTAAGTRTVAFASGGVGRTARVDLPVAAAGAPISLIVALHFAGGTGAQMAAYTGLSAPAVKAGFAVAYPTATKADHVWRLQENADGVADVRLVGDMLDAVRGAACIDGSRVFATGVSNGGGMAARLGCGVTAPFRGVAPVAPGLKAVPPCPAGGPVGILEIHGLADRVVPYAGTGPHRAGAVAKWLDNWRLRNWCGRVEKVRRGGRRSARVTRAAFTCRRAPVEHITLEGTDHGWPGSGGPFPRRDPTGFDTGAEVVRFFARFPPVAGAHG